MAWKNDMEMYSVHSEGESVVAQRFTKTLKNKIYKYMTMISYNNTYDSTFKIEPGDVKSNTYVW